MKIYVARSINLLSILRNVDVGNEKNWPPDVSVSILRDILIDQWGVDLTWQGFSIKTQVHVTNSRNSLWFIYISPSLPILNFTRIANKKKKTFIRTGNENPSFFLNKLNCSFFSSTRSFLFLEHIALHYYLLCASRKLAKFSREMKLLMNCVLNELNYTCVVYQACTMYVVL